MLVVTENSVYRIEEFPDYFELTKLKDRPGRPPSRIPIGHTKQIEKDKFVTPKLGESLTFGGLTSSFVVGIKP